VGEKTIALEVGVVETADLTLVKASVVDGYVTASGVAAKNVPIVFRNEARQISAVTDENGHYSVTLPVGNYTAFAMSADGSWAAIDNTLDADQNSETLNIALKQAHKVSGTVTSDEVGASGATITFTSKSGGAIKAVADATGNYSMILPEGSYWVYATRSGGASYMGELDMGTEAVVWDIVLGDSKYLTGITYDDYDGDGTRASNEGTLASVLLTFTLVDDPSIVLEVLTSSYGAYNLSVPTDAGDFSIKATKAGYQDRTAQAGTSVNISMVSDLRTVTGMLLDENGVPLGGTLITFSAVSNTTREFDVTTAADGSFTLQVKPDTYYAVVDAEVAPGSDAAKRMYNETVVVSPAVDPDALTINATVAYKVSGEIVFPEEGGTGTIRLIGAKNVSLDAASPFPLYLPAGDYSVYTLVTHNSNYWSNLTSFTLGSGGVDLGQIALGKAYPLRGQLQYNGVSLEIAGTATVSQGPAALPVNSSSDGSFVVYLPEGSYSIEAEAQGTATVDNRTRHVTYNGTATVEFGGEEYVNVDLSRYEYNSVLSGNLTVATGGSVAPLSGQASWQFVPLDDYGRELNGTSNGSSYSFSLAPGAYSVYITDGSGNQYLGYATVKAFENSTASFKLEPGVRAEGYVNYEGSPEAGATVEFSNGAYARATTDSAGRYELYLPEDAYTLTAKITDQREKAGVDITYMVNTNATVSSDPSKHSVPSPVELVRELKGAVQLTLSAPHDSKPIARGGTVTYDLTIRNTGNLDDTYELSGTSGWNATFSQSSVSLAWGESATVTVTLTAPADAIVAHPDVVITAKSTAHTSAEGTAVADVAIEASHSASIARDGALEADATTIYVPFLVSNTGTASDIYNFTVQNLAKLKDAGWNVTIYGTSETVKVLSVSAGSAQTVVVQLTRNQSVASVDYSVPVDVRVSGTGPTSDFSALMAAGQLGIDDSLSASGRGAENTAPGMTGLTWALLVLIALAVLALVVSRVNKGVLGRRRKR